MHMKDEGVCGMGLALACEFRRIVSHSHGHGITLSKQYFLEICFYWRIHQILQRLLCTDPSLLTVELDKSEPHPLHVQLCIVNNMYLQIRSISNPHLTVTFAEEGQLKSMSNAEVLSI